MKPYKKMLYMCSITDFLFWFVDMLVEIKLKQRNEVLLVKLEGPASFLSRSFHIYGVAAHVTGVNLSMTVLPAQAFFRYYSLKHSEPLSTLKTICLFSISFTSALIPGTFAWFTFDRSADVNPGFNYGTVWFQEYPLPTLLVGNMKSIYPIMYFGVTVVNFVISYFLLVLFSYFTMKKMQEHYHKYTNQTKKSPQTNELVFILSSTDNLDHIFHTNNDCHNANHAKVKQWNIVDNGDDVARLVTSLQCCINTHHNSTIPKKDSENDQLHEKRIKSNSGYYCLFQ
ncbi:unnamed protein product [Bursaphelenchus okinawaensis]|uniref:7TM_GPCR_Srx domain-containing protein n=1 Tax=Bursaphelenchus okinawaensis TaxID=465554 RepID=A0A811LSX9_9BILA|nr:unnamed protein product [Bursaphelenchus okinawaensis]CAG9128498.1 unnamed protein product [Bursaphelenchus okinawaensis]